MIKKTAILIIILLIISGVFILVKKRGATKPDNTISAQPVVKTDQSNESPKIVSTEPDPLDNTIIPTTQIIEITFNRPLENVGEFKLRMEPKIDYKLELSGDRKTAKIIPVKPYQLGTGYTIYIGSETKFDGVGRWGEEKIYHFRTIKYTGV